MVTKKKTIKKPAKAKVTKPAEEKEPVSPLEEEVGFKKPAPPVELGPGEKAERMKKVLAAQPKVSFMIPLAEGEKEGAFETVCLNGYLFKIKKGVMVSLPQQVAEVLAESYRITLEASQKFLASRSKESEEALE